MTAMVAEHDRDFFSSALDRDFFHNVSALIIRQESNPPSPAVDAGGVGSFGFGASPPPRRGVSLPPPASVPLGSVALPLRGPGEFRPPQGRARRSHGMLPTLPSGSAGSSGSGGGRSAPTSPEPPELPGHGSMNMRTFTDSLGVASVGPPPGLAVGPGRVSDDLLGGALDVLNSGAPTADHLRQADCVMQPRMQPAGPSGQPHCQQPRSQSLGPPSNPFVAPSPPQRPLQANAQNRRHLPPRPSSRGPRASNGLPDSGPTNSVPGHFGGSLGSMHPGSSETMHSPRRSHKLPTENAMPPASPRRMDLETPSGRRHMPQDTPSGRRQMSLDTPSGRRHMSLDTPSGRRGLHGNVAPHGGLVPMPGGFRQPMSMPGVRLNPLEAAVPGADQLGRLDKLPSLAGPLAGMHNVGAQGAGTFGMGLAGGVGLHNPGASLPSASLHGANMHAAGSFTGHSNLNGMMPPGMPASMPAGHMSAPLRAQSPAFGAEPAADFLRPAWQPGVPMRVDAASALHMALAAPAR